MFAYPLRTAALAAAAMVGLSGCAYNGLYSGVSVGAGSGYYDPYGGYGYGYGASYPGYAYGYGASPYYGWYDDFYYPGTGYYVYDRYRRAHRWSDRHRRYWEARRERSLVDGFRGVATNWSAFERDGTAATSRQVRRDVASPVRVERRVDRPTRAERGEARSERRTVRAERQSARSERRSESRSERSNSRRGDDNRER